MDRRKNKTHKAIVSAFSELLIKMPYESITVQNIIEKADVGRSTFYSHFETKDDLVYALCEEAFDHVMSKEQILCEKTHDFSDKTKVWYNKRSVDCPECRTQHLL